MGLAKLIDAAGKTTTRRACIAGAAVAPLLAYCYMHRVPGQDAFGQFLASEGSHASGYFCQMAYYSGLVHHVTKTVHPSIVPAIGLSIFGVGAEILSYVSKNGYADWKDIVANTVGISAFLGVNALCNLYVDRKGLRLATQEALDGAR